MDSAPPLADLARSRFADRSVLVTGGCGFIGSHLVEVLAAGGARVAVLDNLQAGKWSNLDAAGDGVARVEGDVRDAAAVRAILDAHRPEVVFHLAANASVPGSVQDPVYDYEANASGTFVVLEALRQAGGCEKVVCASSGAVYGEPRSFPIVETDPLAPISPYGASKLCAEVQARIYARVYESPAVLARIFNAYGPRMARFVVLDFLRKLQADPERLEVLGSGQQVRDFTYVRDTVQGLMRLASDGVPGEAYNLSSGGSCSVLELAAAVIAARGLTDTTRIHTTGSSWVGDAQRWEVCIEKIAGLGYAPMWTLDAGLRETIAWFDGGCR